MSIEFKDINDRKIWNDRAKDFKYSTFIDSWEWGEFRRSSGEEFLQKGIYKDNRLVGLLPISVINAKRGKYLHLRHAPLLEWEDLDLVHETVAYLRDLATKYGSWFIRISPLIDDINENRDLLELFQFKSSKAHEVDAEHTLVVDLMKDDEQLLSEMRKNTRYSIRKAKKMGVEVEIYTDLSRFDEFYEIFIDAVERNKWVAFTKDYLKNEFESFAKNDKATMILSKYENKYISASIFTYFGRQSAYHHSGSLTQYRNVPSAYLMQWEAMKYAKEKGYREHNLWGVVDKDDKDHPWYGLSLFKWGFGGSERKLVHAHDLIVNLKAHATRMYEMLESKKNGY